MLIYKYFRLNEFLDNACLNVSLKHVSDIA